MGAKQSATERIICQNVERYRMAEENTKNAGLPPKRKKFRELAENRTNRALEAIGRIGNLSNRQLYKWEDGEVRRIVMALKKAVSEVEGRFASPEGKANAKFKL